MTKYTLFYWLLVLTVVSCGGPKSHLAGDALQVALTHGQIKVAHFSTADGTIGLVVDRSAEPTKVRLDNKPDIIELTMEEDRDAGGRRGFYFKSPDGKNMLYLNVEGFYQLYTDRDTFPLRADKEVAPLPDATIKGQYIKPKSPYEIALEQLTSWSVRAKFPRFKPEDSGNLKQIANAFELVDASMFVRVTAIGSQNANYAPASARIGDTSGGLGGAMNRYPNDEVTWNKGKGKGLQKYGGILMDDHPEYDRPSRLRMHELKNWPSPLAEDTPGIIWSVDDGTVVFVTLDGGRYEISLNASDDKIELPVTPGLAPQASWPPPLQHTLVDVDSVRSFAKGNAIVAKFGTDMEALDDRWFNCVNGVWKKTKAELAKIETSQAADTSARAAGIQKKAAQNAVKQCAPEKTKLEGGLVKFIEARNAERLRVYKKAKARAVAVGAAK